MELCLGTVQLGMQYGIQNNEKPSRLESVNILSTAIQHNIFWFDTAPAYGDAENILGSYIAEHTNQSKKLHIVSKISADVFSDKTRKEWNSTVRRCVEETLSCLNRDRLDVCMLHNASCIFDAEAVNALDAARQDGLVDMIGVSTYTPAEAMKALSYPQIGAIQVPYNVFDHRLDQCGFFEEAREKNVKIFARSSLLQGLAAMEIENLPAHLSFATPYIEKFRSICAKAGLSPLQAAVGFVTSHPDIQYLVFGTDNQNQLLEYIAIASAPFPINLRNELESAFDIVEETLINPSLWNRLRVI